MERERVEGERSHILFIYLFVLLRMKAAMFSFSAVRVCVCGDDITWHQVTWCQSDHMVSQICLNHWRQDRDPLVEAPVHRFCL